MIADELHQRSIGIAEIDAGSVAQCAVASDRAKLNRNVLRFEVPLCIGDRPVPAETEITVAGRDGNARQRLALLVRPVAVELLGAQPKDETATLGGNGL